MVSGTGLTTGTIAGIVVGSVGFILLVLAGMFTACKIRRRKRARRDGDPDGGVPELHGAAIQVYEKDPTGILEKDSEPINPRYPSGRGNTTKQVPLVIAVEMEGSGQRSDQLMSGAAVGRSGTLFEAQSVNLGQQYSPGQPQPLSGPVEVVSHNEQIVSPQPHDPITTLAPPATTTQPTSFPSTTVPNAEAGASNANRNKTAELLERQARLRERRERLLELDRLEREEEEIQRQLRESQGYCSD